MGPVSIWCILRPLIVEMGKNLARTERIELEAKVWKEPNRTATDMQKTCRIGTDRTEHTNTNKLESNQELMVVRLSVRQICESIGPQDFFETVWCRRRILHLYVQERLNRSTFQLNAGVCSTHRSDVK